jgi:hypothetical protein
MKRLSAVLFVLLLCSITHAQQRWERTYGGTSFDCGYSVQQTSDGGYIVAGMSSSFGPGANDVYLFKTNSQGDTLWTRTYGGMRTQYAYSVQQTSDGGYIIAGITNSFGPGDCDVYLIKTNGSGDTLWTRTYGGTNDDEGFSVQQTSDGGYIIAGLTNSFGVGNGDVWLIKTNTSGDTLWTRTYGGTSLDWGFSVQQTSDGGYIVTGMTSSFGAGSNDVYLFKTNSQGDTLWTSTYGGTRSDAGYSVQQTLDGGYIVAGWNRSLRDTLDCDVYLIKTNASGDTLWTKTFGGTNWDYGYSVQQTSDGGYIVAGLTWSFGAGSDDFYLIKTNGSGETLWTRTYGGTNDDEGFSVQQTSDGGYIIAGLTLSFGAGGDDAYLIKTDTNGNVGVEEAGGNRRKAVGSIKVSPNPFTTFATVPGHSSEPFSLYDISGRRVGTYRGDRIGADVPQGVYFLRPLDSKDKPLRIVKVR